MKTKTHEIAEVERLPTEISAGKYYVRIAQTQNEIESALRLRYEVFNIELKGSKCPSGLDFDEFDFNCKHLIVVEKTTRRTVGSYRLNSIETVGVIEEFYSYGEFSIEDLPPNVLDQAVEIGRACIAREHRNTKVLFLLWKGLANYIKEREKRFLFGCCSIFTTDCEIGVKAFRQLKREKFLHQSYRVAPRLEKICQANDVSPKSEPIKLPDLFNMYLRIGAKICGTPIIDREFGTIDFFVLFDIKTLNGKYRRLFLNE